MVPISVDTPLNVVLTTVTNARTHLARHGCMVEEECPEAIRDMPLSECEYVCHLEDLPGLLAALNAEAR